MPIRSDVMLSKLRFHLQGNSLLVGMSVCSRRKRNRLGGPKMKIQDRGYTSCRTQVYLMNTLAVPNLLTACIFRPADIQGPAEIPDDLVTQL